MKKLRLIPALVTLLAGAVTSVTLYLFRMNYILSLIILLLVLIVFYVIGVIAMKVLMDFRKAAEAKEAEGASPDSEGEVIEKENL